MKEDGACSRTVEDEAVIAHPVVVAGDVEDDRVLGQGLQHPS